MALGKEISVTALVLNLHENFSFIGIDIKKEYVEIARKRIADAKVIA